MFYTFDHTCLLHILFNLSLSISYFFAIIKDIWISISYRSMTVNRSTIISVYCSFISQLCSTHLLALASFFEIHQIFYMGHNVICKYRVLLFLFQSLFLFFALLSASRNADMMAGVPAVIPDIEVMPCKW